MVLPTRSDTPAGTPQKSVGMEIQDASIGVFSSTFASAIASASISSSILFALSAALGGVWVILWPSNVGRGRSSSVLMVVLRCADGCSPNSSSGGNHGIVLVVLRRKDPSQALAVIRSHEAEDMGDDAGLSLWAGVFSSIGVCATGELDRPKRPVTRGPAMLDRRASGGGAMLARAAGPKLPELPPWAV